MTGRKRWVWPARGALGLGILATLIWRSRGSAIVEALQALHGPTWLAAVAIYLGGQAMCAWKWGFLARALGMERRYSDLLAYYFGGMFANLFLPGTVGGDVGRALALTGPDGSLKRALVTVLADRGSGFVALLLLATAGVALLPNLPSWLYWCTVAGAMVVIFGCLWALSSPERFRRLGESAESALAECRRSSILWPVAALSLLFQGIVVLVHFLVGRALGLDVPWSYYLVAGTLGAVVAMVPVSVNGLGTRDAAYVFFLGLASVPRETALAFALSWLALIAVCGGIGGLVFVLLAPGQMALFTRRKAHPVKEE